MGLTVSTKIPKQVRDCRS